MSKLRVDEVVTKGEVYPIIVTFQNGYTTDHFGPVDSYLLEDEKTGRKRIATEIDKILYVGEEDHEESGNTFLLARNRITGKVRLIEVGRAELKPNIRSNNEVSELLNTSSLELSRKFGSKKNKKKMEHSEKLKVNIDTVTEQLKNVTKSATKAKIDMTPYLVQNSDDFYIPPIDRQAAKVEDIYDKDKILTQEQYEKVFSEIESKDYTEEYHPIIASIVAPKKLSQTDTVLALYASCLYKMFLILCKDIVKKAFCICSSSPTLNEIVLTNFTQMANNKRTRPAPFKDKALCHAMVITLLLNHYKLDMESIATALKMTPSLVTTKARATSASIVASGNKRVIQLKLPLPINKPFRRKSTKF